MNDLYPLVRGPGFEDEVGYSEFGSNAVKGGAGDTEFVQASFLPFGGFKAGFAKQVHDVRLFVSLWPSSIWKVVGIAFFPADDAFFLGVDEDFVQNDLVLSVLPSDAFSSFTGVDLINAWLSGGLEGKGGSCPVCPFCGAGALVGPITVKNGIVIVSGFGLVGVVDHDASGIV